MSSHTQSTAQLTASRDSCGNAVIAVRVTLSTALGAAVGKIFLQWLTCTTHLQWIHVHYPDRPAHFGNRKCSVTGIWSSFNACRREHLLAKATVQKTNSCFRRYTSWKMNNSKRRLSVYTIKSGFNFSYVLQWKLILQNWQQSASPTDFLAMVGNTWFQKKFGYCVKYKYSPQEITSMIYSKRNTSCSSHLGKLYQMHFAKPANYAWTPPGIARFGLFSMQLNAPPGGILWLDVCTGFLKTSWTLYAICVSALPWAFLWDRIMWH